MKHLVLHQDSVCRTGDKHHAHEWQDVLKSHDDRPQNTVVGLWYIDESVIQFDFGSDLIRFQFRFDFEAGSGSKALVISIRNRNPNPNPKRIGIEIESKSK